MQVQKKLYIASEVAWMNDANCAIFNTASASEVGKFRPFWGEVI